jgi:hypothetical protein
MRRSLKKPLLAAKSLSWFWVTRNGPSCAGYVERVVAAVDAATPGSYTEVDIPFG